MLSAETRPVAAGRRTSCDCRALVALAALLLIVCGCDDDDDGGMQPPPAPNFTNTILPIFQASCATSGCHDAGTAAHGLALDSYTSVMRGSDDGEAVIPFSSAKSLMIELLEGRAASGTVDHRKDAVLARGTAVLAEGDSEELVAWIDAGCPNDDGVPAFSSITEKVYVTDQRADLISVVGADDLVVTRLIAVEPFAGSLEALPHFGSIDASNDVWFATMLDAPGLWKFDAADTVVAKLEMMTNKPALSVITPDGAKAYISHFVSPQSPAPGLVSVIDMATFTVIEEIPVLNTPHGMAIAADGSEVYVANFGSDHITVIDTADDSVVEQIPVAADIAGNPNAFVYKMIQIDTHPTRPLIYASCTGTNEVRVIDRTTGTVVDSVVIQGGSAPWHLKVTPDGSKLYVANRGQPLMGGPLEPGSVSVFTTDPFELEALVTGPGLWLTHGLDFDASGRYCFVSSENANGGYEARHPVEGESPGTVTVIDTATNQVVKTLEVEAFATGVFATR